MAAGLLKDGHGADDRAAQRMHGGRRAGTTLVAGSQCLRSGASWQAAAGRAAEQLARPPRNLRAAASHAHTCPPAGASLWVCSWGGSEVGPIRRCFGGWWEQWRRRQPTRHTLLVSQSRTRRRLGPALQLADDCRAQGRGGCACSRAAVGHAGGGGRQQAARAPCPCRQAPPSGTHAVGTSWRRPGGPGAPRGRPQAARGAQAQGGGLLWCAGRLGDALGHGAAVWRKGWSRAVWALGRGGTRRPGTRRRRRWRPTGSRHNGQPSPEGTPQLPPPMPPAGGMGATLDKMRRRGLAIATLLRCTDALSYMVNVQQGAFMASPPPSLPNLWRVPAPLPAPGAPGGCRHDGMQLPWWAHMQAMWLYSCLCCCSKCGSR